MTKAFIGVVVVVAAISATLAVVIARDGDLEPGNTTSANSSRGGSHEHGTRSVIGQALAGIRKAHRLSGRRRAFLNEDRRPGEDETHFSLRLRAIESWRKWTQPLALSPSQEEQLLGILADANHLARTVEEEWGRLHTEHFIHRYLPDLESELREELERADPREFELHIEQEVHQRAYEVLDSEQWAEWKRVPVWGFVTGLDWIDVE